MLSRWCFPASIRDLKKNYGKLEFGKKNIFFGSTNMKENKGVKSLLVSI